MIDEADVGLGGVGAAEVDDGDDAEGGRLIRPYAMTGGRTRRGGSSPPS